THKPGRKPGFGAVEKLPSGRYRARYSGPDGRRYTAPTTFRTKGEARGRLSLRHAEIVRKTWEPPSVVPKATHTTLAAYAEQWLVRNRL
ncbi:MAG: site-specific integrase, partial [Mycobacterium sp.]